MDSNYLNPQFVRRKKLEEEITRLKAKKSAVDDKDIRDALELRIAAVSEELAAIQQEQAAPEEEKEEPLPEPPTEDQKLAAEKLIQQARVADLRGQVDAAIALLSQAQEIAPGSEDVLELQGDLLLKKGDNAKALKKYDLAKKLAPQNVSIGQKHAELVFKTRALPESMIGFELGSSNVAASPVAATLFSLVVPGVGQLVLEEYVAGALFLIGWAACLIWLIMDRNQLLSLIPTHKGLQGAPKSFGVFVPIILLAILHIFSALLCYSKVDRSAGKKNRPQHPQPPVRLPFD